MALSAVAPLAASVLLPAAVARTKKSQLQREDDEDDLCKKDRQLARPRREETPVDHPSERDRPLVAFGGTFVDSARSIDVALSSRGRRHYWIHPPLPIVLPPRVLIPRNSAGDYICCWKGDKVSSPPFLRRALSLRRNDCTPPPAVAFGGWSVVEGVMCVGNINEAYGKPYLSDTR